MYPTGKTSKGYLGQKPSVSLSKFMVIDGEAQEIHDVVVHRFKITDADDPEIYAAVPIIRWKESEQGQWVLERTVETPLWHRRDDPFSFYTEFAITAKLKDRDYVVWLLKYKEEQ